MSKKGLGITAVILLVCGIIFFYSCPVTSKQENEEVEFHKLDKDIQALNLINSLYLTKSQVKRLIPIVQEAEKLHREAKREMENYRERALPIYTDMREELSHNIDVSDDMKKRFNEHYHKGEIKKEELEKRLEDLVDRAENVLNENQLVMLGEYQPCHIPQRSVTHPERIGQVSDNFHIIQILSKLRQLPDDKFNEKKPVIEEKLRKKLNKKIKDPVKKEEVFNKVMSLVHRVRAMNNEQFEIEKERMIEDIKPLVKNKYEVNLEELKRNYIRRFLLNPGTLDILKERV